MSRKTAATYGSSAPAKVRRGSSVLRTDEEDDSERRVAAVQDAAAACSALLAKRKVQTANLYACGSWGCVYPAGPGRVAKLSWDVGEAELAILFAQARGAHPALPRIFYVGQLPQRCGRFQGAPLYVVVREDLQDLTKHIEPDAARRLGTLLFFVPGWDGHAYRARSITPDMIEELRARWPRAFAFWRQAADFAVWARGQGIALEDTHLANWGVRDGRQIVLRDFGLSSSSRSPGPEAVPTLQGLRGLRGLAIRGLRRK